MESFYTEVTPDPVEDPENLGGRRFFLDLLETVIFSVALFFLINAVTARIRVESVSMQPTLYENDFVLVNRVAYKLGSPQRGDVIVFRYPRNPDSEPYIKRVIGLPGDQVLVSDGVVYINGNPIREPYIKAAPAYSGKWQVPQDELFVLGDNRNNSSDSHSWGMVPLNYVIGKAEAIYLPPSHWRILHQAAAAAAQP
jgi:signal peptidase I